MRQFLIIVVFAFLFSPGGSPVGAQEAARVSTSPFDIERLSEGMVFQGHITLDSGQYKESLLATGACVISKGKFVSSPRVENAIMSAGEQTRHVFDEDASPDDGAGLIAKLIDQEDKKPGDSHCLVQRRVETGCVFGTCLTARQFDVYLLSYDKKARPLGSGTDVCGGNVFRGAGECLPVISGGAGNVAGLAVCIETQADLKAGGKQPASLVFAYGIVPKAVAAQAGSATARQDTNCAARGLASTSGPQGAPVAVTTGSPAEVPESGEPPSQTGRSWWRRMRLPRLPKQPKKSVVDEYRD